MNNTKIQHNNSSGSLVSLIHEKENFLPFKEICLKKNVSFPIHRTIDNEDLTVSLGAGIGEVPITDRYGNVIYISSTSNFSNMTQGFIVSWDLENTIFSARDLFLEVKITALCRLFKSLNSLVIIACSKGIVNNEDIEFLKSLGVLFYERDFVKIRGKLNTNSDTFLVGVTTAHLATQRFDNLLYFGGDSLLGHDLALAAKKIVPNIKVSTLSIGNSTGKDLLTSKLFEKNYELGCDYLVHKKKSYHNSYY